MLPSPASATGSWPAPADASADLRLLPFAALLASPYLLAISFSPSSTALNQLLTLVAWGLLLALGALPARAGSLGGGAAAARWPLLVLLAMALAAAASWAWQGLPSSMALSAGLMLVSAAVVLRAAVAAEATPAGAGGVFWAGLLLAGLLSSLVALIQVFMPSWADGTFIARSGLPGRAVGNVRQPNHLSTLLLWALIALVPVARTGRVLGLRVARRALLALGLLLTFGVVLTASRTGVLGVLMLAAWGALDKRLGRSLRLALVAAPVAYLVLWLGMSAWSHLTAATFGGEARLAEGDLSASRFGIWSNAWAMVLAQPWTGVGLGNFNFAWSLTPFPGRPVAFFDHTHNLPLHLAAELGLPLAALLMAALLRALWLAWRRSLAQPREEEATAGRAAAMIVMLAGVHSLLEYPLWYGYFLLPTAWAFGLALRDPAAPQAPAAGAEATPVDVWHLLQRLAGVALVLGAMLAALDYQRVVVIYQPGDTRLSLEERIQRGQRSPLYGHHADYAAATTIDPPALAMDALARTAHSLIDTRLMMTWAQALAQSGQEDKARYLAARLREFRNPASASFLAICQTSPDEGQAETLFQCQPPQQAWHWRDFLPQPPSPARQ